LNHHTIFYSFITHSSQIMHHIPDAYMFPIVLLVTAVKRSYLDQILLTIIAPRLWGSFSMELVLYISKTLCFLQTKILCFAPQTPKGHCISLTHIFFIQDLFLLDMLIQLQAIHSLSLLHSNLNILLIIIALQIPLLQFHINLHSISLIL